MTLFNQRTPWRPATEHRGGGRVGPRDAVVLASFDSEYSMSEKQAAEMARGPDLSGEPFVWYWVVLFPRAPAKRTATAQRMGCPAGWRPGRVGWWWRGGRRVMGHGPCSAFVTHCGWTRSRWRRGADGGTATAHRPDAGRQPGRGGGRHRPRDA